MVFMAGIGCFIAGVVFGVSFIEEKGEGAGDRLFRLGVRAVALILGLYAAYTAHTHSIQVF